MNRRQAKQAIYINGVEHSITLKKHLLSLTSSNRAGTNSDTATLVFDNSSGQVVLPKYGAELTLYLWFKGEPKTQVFSGKVDHVKSSGSRSGRTITVTAKGINTEGKAKEPQQRHFDDMSIKDMLTAAAEYAEITDVRVDDDLGAIVRDYEHMDDESLVAFGERLATEIGGTFKIRTDIVIMAKRNGGTAPSGDPLPPVLVSHGDNLHSWDVSPFIGRKRYKEIRVRYYDSSAARWDEVKVTTDIEGSDAIATGRFEAHNKQAAEEKARSIKAESERNSSAGTLKIEGVATAQPEAVCVLTGLETDVSGSYRIDGVDHQYGRSGGFVTTLKLKQRL